MYNEPRWRWPVQALRLVFTKSGRQSALVCLMVVIESTFSDFFIQQRFSTVGWPPVTNQPIHGSGSPQSAPWPTRAVCNYLRFCGFPEHSTSRSFQWFMVDRLPDRRRSIVLVAVRASTQEISLANRTAISLCYLMVTLAYRHKLTENWLKL